MRDDWYYSGPEGQRGPVTLQQLRDTLAAHPAADDLFIWHESLSGWVRAGDVAEILAGESTFDGGMVAEPRERYSAITGLLLGGVAIIVGCSLFYLGISGNVAKLAKAYGLTTELVEASPGALLFVIGLFVIWGARYRVTAK
jgi:hypothetical protein